MSEKRRGLGRGLGALIPTVAAGDRPVDVFFPNEPRAARPGSSAGAKDALVPTGPVHPERGTGSARTDDDDARADVTSATATDGRSSGGDGGSAGARGPAASTLEQGAAADADDAPQPDAAQPGAASARRGDSASAPARASGRGSAGRAAAMAGVLKPVTLRRPQPADASRGQDEEHHAQSGPGASGGATTSGESGGSRPESTAGPREISSVSRETYAAAVGDLAPDELVPVPGATFAELPIDAIRPNSRQPRTVFDENDLAELVGSIQEIGVLQPIVVRPEPDGSGYELIMGERRWRASREAGLSVIPAIIRETDDADLLRDALLENLHRSALNPLEEAAAYRQLLDDFGCTHEELASRISRSRPQISNTLRLLRLPPLVQRRVAAGVLSAGHARALLGLTDGSEIERLAQRIVAEGLSVRATEEIVSLGARGTEEKPAVRRPRRGGRIQAIDELAGRLSDRFETRVKVDLGKTKGKLTVEFASVEDLNRILAVMAPEEEGLLKKP